MTCSASDDATPLEIVQPFAVIVRFRSHVTGRIDPSDDPIMVTHQNRFARPHLTQVMTQPTLELVAERDVGPLHAASAGNFPISPVGGRGTVAPSFRSYRQGNPLPFGDTPKQLGEVQAKHSRLEVRPRVSRASAAVVLPRY